MRIALLAALLLSSCAAPNWGPVSARQRAEASTDVPEDHPHPPALLVPSPLDGSFDKLHCWNNGEDTVCSRPSDTNPP